MEIISKPESDKLYVIKTIEEEIADCKDEEVKKQLLDFKKDWDHCVSLQKTVVEPALNNLGNKLNDFNDKQKKNKTDKS